MEASIPPFAPKAPSYRLLEALCERTTRAIFVFDINSNSFFFLNHAFENIFQTTNLAALITKVHPKDLSLMRNAYLQLKSRTEMKDVEFRLRLHDNTIRWVSATLFHLEEESGHPKFVGYADDITAHRKSCETLPEFCSKKHPFLHILAHDLAGHLAVLGSVSSLLAEKLKPYGDKELSHLTSIVERIGRQSAQMVQDYMKLDFLKSAKVELKKQRVDLANSIREVIAEHEELETSIGRLFLFHKPGSKVFAQIDENKFRQVIDNLLSNAIKFTPEGGIISIDLNVQKDKVLIKVKDSGIGIPKRFHNGLFDEFTKAKREGLLGEPSTGLGMSIIKTIVEWHKGRIWFESEEKVGTTFYIELPKE